MSDGTIFGYTFRKPDLLRQALTHRSAAASRQVGPRARRGQPSTLGSNERLEFVGDRVLGLVVAEWLVERFPREAEGALARRQAHLVARPLLAELAAGLGLSQLIDVAPNEARAGVGTLPTVLADTMEAVIGAIFLDSNLDPARTLIRTAWAAAMEAQVEPPQDAKTALQEWLGARGKPLPVYTVTKQDGPPHAPSFVVLASGGGAEGSGRAGTKQAAERAAASELLGRLTS